MTSNSPRELFGTDHPVIGMVRFPPLPRTALHDRTAGVSMLFEVVQADVRALADAGLDAVLFCNEGDRPYALQAPPEAIAAMSAVIATCAPEAIPFGVDYLWDAAAALAVAHATGAAFVREVFTGAYESDMGLWSPDPSQILRYRTDLGADDVRLFMNVTPEFASPLGTRPVGIRARSAVVNALADVILVSGALAGDAVNTASLTEAKNAVGDSAPVFVNTGVTAATVGHHLEIVDGVIVGTDLKVDAHTWNPVDPARARAFMEAARAAR